MRIIEALSDLTIGDQVAVCNSGEEAYLGTVTYVDAILDFIRVRPDDADETNYETIFQDNLDTHETTLICS